MIGVVVGSDAVQWSSIISEVVTFWPLRFEWPRSTLPKLKNEEWLSDHVSNSPFSACYPLFLRQNTSRRSLLSKTALLLHLAGRKLGAR
jgi:hypothetical protein